MDVRKASIKKFISSSDIVFVIPVYQRNYDWDKENCLQLFSDVKSLVGGYSSHFMGTICYKMEGRYKCVIIDGQQRITSIMLFMKALHDVTENDRLRQKIRDQFLINPYAGNDLKLKLKPIKKDEDVYTKLINIEKMSPDYFSKEEKNSNIFKNYSLFCEWIINEKNNGIDEADIEDAIERLEIAEIELTDENPQIIFESLNSTGMNLTNTDLLRNYLLMSMDYKDQEELYHKYWLQIENLLGSNSMEAFLIYYLITYRKSNAVMERGKKAVISSKNLYHAFKVTFPMIAAGNAKEEITALFNELYRYANYYKHFQYDADTNYRTLNKIDKKLYELFYLLDEKHSAVLALYLYNLFDENKLNEDTFIELLDVCICFAFRSKVCNHQGLIPQFCGNVIAKLDAQPIDSVFVDRFWSAIISGRGRFAFPRDDEFREALVNHELYVSLKSAGSKYLLYKLELNREHSKELPPYASGSVEHILPQTLSDEWSEYLSERHELQLHDKLLHTLGNLALTNYNSKLSNNMLAEKQEEYAQSNYAYTKELASWSEWSGDAVRIRAERMANEALKVWPMPEVYNADEPIETGTTYNLQSDFPSFVGTRPAVVSVCGQEETVSTWADFVILAATKFYDLDASIFREMIDSPDFKGSDKLFGSTDQNMRRSVKLAEDLFINLDYHTDENLQNIKKIADFFDVTASTNFAEDIWFTVRKK